MKLECTVVHSQGSRALIFQNGLRSQATRSDKKHTLMDSAFFKENRATSKLHEVQVKFSMWP